MSSQSEVILETIEDILHRFTELNNLKMFAVVWQMYLPKTKENLIADNLKY